MEFEDTLNLVKEMLAKGEAFISLSPPFGSTIEIDKSVARKYLQEKNLIGSESEFKAQAGEAGELLAPILEDSRESFLTSRVAHRTYDKSKNESPEQTREEISRRLELVKRYLYNERLQRRYNLKKSSKAPSFASIDWDIKTKYADAKIESLSPFPYATCKVTYQREFDLSPSSILNGFGSVQINFSVDEIHYLQRVLSTIEERLRAVEKELTK